MFTGIIEELGIVASFIRNAQSGRLSLLVGKQLSSAKVGDSIAVNGACLTISAVKRDNLEFDISSETLKRTNLQDLRVGEKVNLERALLVSGRLGGHMVTGHIDGVGEVRSRTNRDKEFDLCLSIPSDLLRYMVPKGSVALDGVSLTIADLREELLVVVIVPHTAKSTTLGEKKSGDRINIEVDVLSKYVERHLRGEFRGISDDTLMKVGFLPLGWTDN